MNPLQIFEEIYGFVPDWVRSMHEFAPDELVHYTSLRTSVMKDGALSRKEKELILIGINAARRYETSMLYHTQGAIDAGATPQEIADTVLSTIISRGLPAWLEGQKAVKFAFEKYGTPSPKDQSQKMLQDSPSCDDYYIRKFGQIPEWAQLMKSCNTNIYVDYTNLRNASLQENAISEVLKELILTGINAAERYPLGVQIHAKGALEKGATKEQLAECFMTAVLTAGIPAWFLGYEFLG